VKIGQQHCGAFSKLHALNHFASTIQTMLTCDWAQALTRYDCRPVSGLDGASWLEIGTPFSLADGCAINVYIGPCADGWVKVSDNGDTLFQVNGMGLDVWHPSRLRTLRDLLSRNKLTIGKQGEIHALCVATDAALVFANVVSGLLLVADWAAQQMGEDEQSAPDLAAELEPYIIARQPGAEHRRNVKVLGASNTEYEFDMQHGRDLIDVIPAHQTSTAFAMRKAGDVQNGPFIPGLAPLFIVDDRKDRNRAMSEISILGAITRAVPASQIM